MLRVKWILLVLVSHSTAILLGQNQFAPNSMRMAQRPDSSAKRIYNIGNIQPGDSVPTVNLREVQIVTFKSQEEWAQ